MRAPIANVMNRARSSVNQAHRPVSMKSASMDQAKNWSRKSVKKPTAARFKKNIMTNRLGLVNSACPIFGSTRTVAAVVRATYVTMASCPAYPIQKKRTAHLLARLNQTMVRLSVRRATRQTQFVTTVVRRDSHLMGPVPSHVNPRANGQRNHFPVVKSLNVVCPCPIQTMASWLVAKRKSTRVFANSIVIKDTHCQWMA